MNDSFLIHRENIDEWRFIGIWADMLDMSIPELENKKLDEFLLLFKEYDTLLEVLQENLRLRNLYNRHKSINEKEKIIEIEEEIKTQILNLPNQIDIFVYHKINNHLISLHQNRTGIF